MQCNLKWKIQIIHIQRRISEIIICYMNVTVSAFVCVCVCLFISVFNEFSRINTINVDFMSAL